MVCNPFYLYEDEEELRDRHAKQNLRGIGEVGSKHPGSAYEVSQETLRGEGRKIGQIGAL